MDLMVSISKKKESEQKGLEQENNKKRTREVKK